MKNRILYILILFFSTELYSKDLSIEAKSITIDKNKKVTLFQNNVVVKTADKQITSEFAEFDKEKQEIILKKNIIAKDNFNNIIRTDYAEFNNINKSLKTIGTTILETKENYILTGEDIFFDNKKKIIKSDKNSVLTDNSGNNIYLENFEYLAEENIFKSVGLIKINDQNDNNYEFSQIYIDTKKKELLGTDIKAFLNDSDFKINDENEPRIFSNSMKLTNQKSFFNKSIFTLCKFREGEKCPPWVLKSNKMTHDNKTKTIYYDNAIVKVYNIPIFYFPYLSHPDPTVKRRSGLLPPAFSDTKNLGSSITIPYFWAISDDKNFTATSRLFVDENPLIMGEYHQAFLKSNFLADFGFTEGYKKTSKTKKAGDKSHFFSKFVKNFKGNDGSDNTLNILAQHVSDDKYLKLYKIKSNLVDYNKETLETSVDFTHSNDDLFFGFNASIYESLKGNYNDKYEYVFPEIVINKNILSDEKFGSFDLQTNFKTQNYDTNKLSNFFVNDLDWESNDIIVNSNIKNTFLGKLRNINYEAKNIDSFKKDTTSEVFGALGLLSEIDFEKKKENFIHKITPKIFLRTSPGSMRKEADGSRLNPEEAFNIDRLENIKNFETGNSLSLGFDYVGVENNIEKFDFSVAQIISEKENKKISSKTGLDEKLSDLVGSSSFNFNDKFNLTHQFAIDQNYQEFNYNDFGLNLEFGSSNLKFNYIEEDKHIGNQEYFKTQLSFKNQDKSLVKFETKRNLITNSSEFYDLSYEYINDCLRAGLVYRREFYNDSEIEPENSLMFNITLTPFGSVVSPKFNR